MEMEAPFDGLLDLCYISYARYSEKRFTQINKALYEGVMLMSLLEFISIKKNHFNKKKLISIKDNSFRLKMK